jgi:hypothetical protein
MIKLQTKWLSAECSVDGDSSSLALHPEVRWLMPYPDAENRFF